MSVKETGSKGNPVLAAIVSFIIPGLGHYITGSKGRGIYWIAGFLGYGFIVVTTFLFGIGIILAFFEPAIHLAAAADAYVQTKE